MNQTNSRQAYSRLVALKSNLPGGITVGQKYVVEFHDILDTLEKEPGQNYDVYRVPKSELRRRITNKNMLTGDVSFSESLECPRAFLMMKLDAVLNSLTISAERKSVGFNAQ